MGKRLEEVDDLIQKYSDLPSEAIFKEDLLIETVLKPKSY